MAGWRDSLFIRGIQPNPHLSSLQQYDVNYRILPNLRRRYSGVTSALCSWGFLKRAMQVGLEQRSSPDRTRVVLLLTLPTARN